MSRTRTIQRRKVDKSLSACHAVVELLLLFFNYSCFFITCIRIQVQIESYQHLLRPTSFFFSFFLCWAFVSLVSLSTFLEKKENELGLAPAGAPTGIYWYSDNSTRVLYWTSSYKEVKIKPYSGFNNNNNNKKMPSCFMSRDLVII